MFFIISFNKSVSLYSTLLLDLDVFLFYLSSLSFTQPLHFPKKRFKDWWNFVLTVKYKILLLAHQILDISDSYIVVVVFPILHQVRIWCYTSPRYDELPFGTIQFLHMIVVIA